MTTHTRLRDCTALFCLAALGASCGGGGDAGAPAPQTVACTASPPPAPPAPSVQDPQVTLTFRNGLGVDGSVVLTLNRTQAPLTVANFLSYVNSGFYNCTIIHRLSPGFVVQGGAYASPVTVGTVTLPTEKPAGAAITLEDNAGLSNLRMTIAMARTSVPDSATSQFFINLANNGFLDRTATARGYAVFGAVSTGSAVIDAMSSAPCQSWSLVPAGDCVPNPNVVLMSAAQTR
jgi:peptidyl-prolyl cis-trans isomerase A (cyclophilin A)